MKKLILLGTLVSSMNLFAFGGGGDGFFVNPKYLVKSYIMNSAEYDVENFVDYITEKNPKVSMSDAVTISEEVIRISQCFDIDARLLLALIRMESAYVMDAVSPTGAVGLTQFTSIGSREVGDQLGKRGSDYANPKNTKYILGVINSCVDNDWEHIWDRAGESWSRQKRLFLRDVQLSVTYGATLLKVYLARFYKDNLDLNTIYYNALRSYNGEPGDRKDWYARNILRFYKEIE